MQTVERRWLLLLNWILVGVDVIGLIAYAGFRYLGVEEHVVSFWGITPLVAGICTVHALYGLLVYPRVSRRNLWFSSIVGFTLSGILLLTVIGASHGAAHYYQLLAIVFIFATSTGGIFAPIVAVILTWLLYFFALTTLNTPAIQDNAVQNAFINVGGTLAGILGWLLFRKQYLTNDLKHIDVVRARLQQEQSRASLILESITDGVMIISPQGIIQLLNKSAADMLGWGKDESLDLDYKLLLVPIKDDEDSTADTTTAIDISIKSGEPSQKVTLFKTKTNRTVYLDIVASPVLQTTDDVSKPDASPETTQLDGIVAVLRDVSAAKAEERQRADFISTASHEMRTPVAAIEGYLALALNDKLSKIDDKARGYLQKAHQNTQHLGQLFQDLLTTTRAEDGHLASHPEVIEMGSYLEQLAANLRVVAQAKNLEITFSIGGNDSAGKVVKPLYYTLADPSRIREVVSNLLDNAIKYTQQGGIVIGLTGDKDVVQCFVRDSGAGIPASDIKHLFQKFYRVDSSITRTVGGTGLGLFISRKIVELYGGRIWAESTVGQGSTFYVNLPRLTAQQAAEYQQAAASETSTTQYHPENANSTGPESS